MNDGTYELPAIIGFFAIPTGALLWFPGNSATMCGPALASHFKADWGGAAQMKRKYYLAIEGEPGSYSAYVPELPTILVTGGSVEELTARAGEAIRLYWDSVRAGISPASMLREIEVELPA
jgi:predicted RNase H-like HicB family nuclease